MLDVFNALNMQTATAVDEEYSFCSDPSQDETADCRNPNWGKATAYQLPRNFRLGVKFSW